MEVTIIYEHADNGLILREGDYITVIETAGGNEKEATALGRMIIDYIDDFIVKEISAYNGKVELKINITHAS